jgi:hypothetical protein
VADDDLKSAEYLAAMHYPRPEGVICFHCQQSAEKYLRYPDELEITPEDTNSAIQHAKDIRDFVMAAIS